MQIKQGEGRKSNGQPSKKNKEKDAARQPIPAMPTGAASATPDHHNHTPNFGVIKQHCLPSLPILLGFRSTDTLRC